MSISTDELLKQCGSMYKLVILAAKRAKELSEGAPALVETAHRKCTSVALEEIVQGKVFYKEDDSEAPEGHKKKGRGGKTKGEKRTR